MEHAVRYRNLSAVYGRGADAVVALDGIDLEIGAREFVAFIGPSGCGKSTLLRLTADLLPQEFIQGDVFINDETPSQARRSNSFAFVFQDPVLLPWRTVLGNVQLPLEVVPKTDRHSRSPRDLIRLVGLEGFEDSLPSTLSGGMRQRVALARALSLDPSVLLMDEPFGALDEFTRDRMQAELLSIWATTDAAVLLVTHSISEAVFLADRVIVMDSRPGRIGKEVDIPFTRPRLSVIKTQVEFLELQNEIRSALGEST